MLGIATALGAKTLAVGSFRLQEEISLLFQIETELASEDDVDLDKVVGQRATIRINIGESDKRYFDGVRQPTRAACQRRALYSLPCNDRALALVPDAHSDCFIF
jgi:uncharacterized protein involved in type VI secretion and phage assembly